MGDGLPKDISFLIRNSVFCAAVFLSIISVEATPGLANPTGGTVAAGAATISSSGNVLDITQTTNKAVIDWRGFDIAPNETTDFIQPSSSAMTLNRINSGSPSQIFGHLSANGNILILNPSGVLFGAGSQVDVNGLIATTAGISNQAFMAGGALSFNQPGNPTAAVINNGTITAADAGLVGLVAPNVINNGVITARLGTVQLASADSFVLDLYGDGLLNFGVSDAVQKQLVANTGKISAAGGKIALTAAAGNSVVNSLISVAGELSAPAAAQKNGHIYIYAEGTNAVPGNVTTNKGQKSGSSTVQVDGYLDASGYGTGQTGGTIDVLGDNVSLMSGALLDASGDSGGGTIHIGGDFHGAGTTPTALDTTVDAGALIMANAVTSGNGGNVAVWSDDYTSFAGNILATGSAQSGNGGFVETSGHNLLAYNGTVDLLAPQGVTGTLLLDPYNVAITNNASATDSCSSGTCTPSGNTSLLNVTTLDTALASSNVTVNTGSSGAQTGTITVNGTADTGGAVAISWSTSNLLTLSAAGGIAIDAGASITNTYNTVNGTFGAGSIPVVLALRVDNGSVNGQGTAAGSSYGVTNNGTINMSGSSGAVSIFNDWNFTAVNGTQTANGSWAAATYALNDTVSSQFTTYKLVNSTSDLAYIGTNSTTLGYTYALGTNINGGAAAFNSNVPLGTFTGILDGQWCALGGGSVCGVTNLTMTSSAANVGLFGASSGTIRNLALGLAVTDSSSNTGTDIVGTLVGNNSGTVANVSATGGINYATTVGAASAPVARVGGLAGEISGTGVIINSAASGNVTYTYAGTSSAAPSTYLGGLVGFDGGTAANSISGSDAVTGTVTAQYSSNGCSGSACTGTVGGRIGGLVGQNNDTSTPWIVNSYSTENVNVSLSGSTNEIGGLVGRNTNGTVSGSYASGTVSATTVGSVATTTYLGGLVGDNYVTATGAITNSYASGAVTYTYAGTAVGTSIADVGGLVGENGSTVANSISGSDAVTGTVTAQYSSNGCSGSACTGNVSGDIGGLVGSNGNTSTSAIVNSYATENVTDNLSGSTQVVGGLVGLNAGTISGTSTATSYASGTVSATIGGSTAISTLIGGLVGRNNGSAGIITNSAASGAVTYTDAGTSTGGNNAYVGGLVGYNDGAAVNSISGSTASGAVKAQYSQTACSGSVCSGIVNGYVGGLAGVNGNASGGTLATGISTSSASGSVSSGLVGGNEYVGGLVGVGWVNSGGDSIANSSASGSVTYTYTGTAAGTTTVYVGGLVGYNGSQAANSISGSYSSGGALTAQYSQTGCSGAACSGVVNGEVGGLVGNNNDASTTAIVDSYSTENVSDSLTGGSQYVGGLVGLNAGTISGTSTATSYASGTVSATIGGSTAISTLIGGLVGRNNGSAGIITNSAASGTVTYTYAGTGVATSTVYFGGLVGLNSSTAATSISGSDATGTVTAQYSQTGCSGAACTGNINGYVGGLVGENGSGGATAISTSFASGSVSSSLVGSNEWVGGLVGYEYSTSVSAIANAYATGAVIYTGSTAGAKIGGLVGYNQSGTILDTYATGYVSASHGTAGGLVGSNGGTVSASYWNTATTGQSTALTGATGVSTATLQNSGTNGGLPSGWDGIATWSIVAGVSYPYLSWQIASGTPQVVSGIAYSNRGVTALADANVAGLINGAALLSAQTGSSVTTGANGYYYFLLAPSTISAGGSDVLTYLTGSTKGNAFYDNATGSLASFNIYGNELLATSASSTLSAITTDLSTALGSNSGGNFLFTPSSGAITATASDTLELTSTASTLNLDKTMTTSGGGAIILNDANAVTQSAAINTPNLLLTSGGTYTLTNSSNSVGTLAGSTGALSLTDSSALTVGTVSGTAGLTASGAVTLMTTGASGSIAVNNNITESTYAGTASLTLAAVTDITLAASKAITASGSTKLNVTLDADTAGAGGAIVLNSGSSITSNGGAITLGGNETIPSNIVAGTGYAVGDAASKYGVYINSATVNAGSGAIIMNGQGYNTSGNSNYGINIASGSTVEVTGASGMALTGIGGGTGASTNDYGLYSAGTIKSTVTGGGGITLIGYSGDNNGSGGSNPGAYIGGGAISSVDGNILIDGNTGINGQAVSNTTGGANDFPSNAGIQFYYSTITSTGNATITLNGIGAGSGASYCDYGVSFGGTGTLITSATGNISITGTGATTTGGHDAGMNLNGGVIKTTGTATISLTGYGGGTGSSGVDYGISVGTTIQSTATGGGGITLIGYGGDNGGSGAANYGTAIPSGTISSVDGAILIDGNTGIDGQAISSTTGNSNDGVYVGATGKVQTSGSGTVTITGAGGGSGASGSSSGIGIDGTVQSTATGGGGITLVGYSGDTGGTGQFNSGISFSGGVSSVDGNIVIKGNTGISGQTVTTSTGHENVGINGGAGGSISSTGKATITLNGIGGGSGTGDTDFGIYLNGPGLQITSVNSDIGITGTAASTTGGSDFGIRLYNPSAVYTTGSGNISLTGVGQNGSAGIYSSDASGTNNIGGASDTGNITFNSDTIILSSTPIQTTGTVTFAPYTASTVVNVATGSTGLQITSGILSNVTAGGITIGATGDTGAMNVGAYTWNAPLTLLNGSGNININGAEAMAGNSLFADTLSGNITLGASGSVSSNASGNAIVLAAGGNFTNSNSSSSALSATGGRWLVYSTTPGADTFGSLNSNNTAVWDATYGGTISQTGNRYVFSYQPTVTFTSTSDSKTYGVNDTSTVATDYSVSGLQASVANAFAADTNATAFSGAPSVTSSGSAASATVAGSTYTMTVAQGTLAGVDGYALAYSSPGALTVNPAALTVTANNESKTYGSTFTFAGTEFTTSGLLNSDSVASATLTSAGTAATATVAGSTYTIASSAALGSGLSNYTITYTNGHLTVNTAPLTITADNESKTYGSTYTFAGTEFTTSGLLNSDSVTSATLTSAGAAATATVAGSTYTIAPSAAVGSGLSNYTISYVNGQFTVNPALLTITADNESKTYGSTYTFAGTEFTTSGLLNSDSVTSATLTSAGAAATATVAGSTYTIAPTAALGAGLSNYTISYVNGHLTVNTAPLTITANDESKMFSDTLVFSGDEFSSAGLKNGESIGSVTLASVGAVNTAAVGPYAIIPTAATGGTFDINNYTPSYVNGVLTISVFSASSLPETVIWVSQNISSPTAVVVSQNAANNVPLSVGQGNETAPVLGVTQNQKQDTAQNYNSPTPNKYENQPSASTLGGILHFSPEVVQRFDLGYLLKELR